MTKPKPKKKRPDPPKPDPPQDKGKPLPKKSDEQVDKEAQEHQAEVNKRFQERLKNLREGGLP